MGRYDASGTGCWRGKMSAECEGEGSGDSSSCVTVALWKKKDEKSKGLEATEVE